LQISGEDLLFRRDRRTRHGGFLEGVGAAELLAEAFDSASRLAIVRMDKNMRPV